MNESDTALARKARKAKGRTCFSQRSNSAFRQNECARQVRLTGTSDAGFVGSPMMGRKLGKACDEGFAPHTGRLYRVVKSVKIGSRLTEQTKLRQ